MTVNVPTTFLVVPTVLGSGPIGYGWCGAGVEEMRHALAVLARLGPDVEHDVREVVREAFLEELARLHLRGVRKPWCEDRVLDGPASGKMGCTGGSYMYCNPRT